MTVESCIRQCQVAGAAMEAATFRRGIEHALLAQGFQQAGKCLQLESSEIAVIVGFDEGFGDQWFINVGFWIHALGGAAPGRVESGHLYFRLERLVPGLRETILMAGALTDNGQEQAYSDLLDLLADQVVPTLKVLATKGGIRSAIERGELADGLIRKEARDHLEQY